ncbi:MULTISPECIES: extracellular solute-binding protein [unclassified Sphingopyxis]|jgi:iron(III) transport system substrate-binding protein|uniref:extracellular solute-binding protein n=1 Tax=unclassified Sphingopyxis TaxID=2614943 RepID=UPI0025EC613C|nr:MULTISPECIES: extracellular solute-binding protein [unclassified Sphingopyxis]
MTTPTRFRPSFGLALGVLALLAGCSQEAGDDKAAGGEKVVNLYSARHYDTDLPLYERFTRETGIRINRIEGNADQLIARMKAEGATSPADLFITADAGALWRAEQAGLFQPVESAVIAQRIPANLREPSGLWTGFMRRARIVAYDSAKVRPEEVDSYDKLAGPRFRGQICVRSADSIYNLSLVGALIEAWGPERAQAWTRGIVANMARPPEGGDRDQIRAVSAGVCQIALTNSYYYIRMASGDDAADKAVTDRVKLAFTSLDGQGAHVNISGGGVARGAPNKANAIRLLEFFTEAATQEHIARHNNEFPASPAVKAPEPVAAYTNFTAHPMAVAAFARRQPEAQKMMSAAGWR